MRSSRLAGAMVAVIFFTVGARVVGGQDVSGRSEIKRADLATTSHMEVITSILELKPGMSVPRHSHHGIESGYVLEGALIQRPGKPPEMMATGTPALNQRDVVHGGFRVVGDKPLRIFTVHIVDKDKPLYEFAKEE